METMTREVDGLMEAQAPVQAHDLVADLADTAAMKPNDIARKVWDRLYAQQHSPLGTLCYGYVKDTVGPLRRKVWTRIVGSLIANTRKESEAEILALKARIAELEARV